MPSRVAVVGLGRIGLPLAVRFAARDLPVVGIDTDAALVEAIAAGRCPYEGEEGLPEELSRAVASGRLTATTEAAEAAAEVVVIIVRVGLGDDGRADFSHLDAAADRLSAVLRRDSLALLETTVPIGTTRGRLGPRLEAAGLRAGADFRLAYSPERVSVGRVLRDLAAYPKVVGGIDEGSTAAAAEFYRQALGVDVIAVPDCETAEFVKLAETTYRDVNIALANELAQYADRWGIDVSAAFAAANSQPYSHLHQPGVGVGGHCIPVNPRFLLDEGSPLRLPALARQANEAMARYAIDRLEAALGGLRGKTVLILGVAYRPGVKEAANSPTFALARELVERGAEPLAHDPLFSAEELSALGLRPAPSFPPPHVDAVILQTAHDLYLGLDFGSLTGCRVVLDGRNALSRQSVESAGLRYLGIGR